MKKQSTNGNGSSKNIASLKSAMYGMNMNQLGCWLMTSIYYAKVKSAKRLHVTKKGWKNEGGAR